MFTLVRVTFAYSVHSPETSRHYIGKALNTLQPQCLPENINTVVSNLEVAKQNYMITKREKIFDPLIS